MDQLLSHASDVYAYDYFGVLFVLAVLEWVLPRQPVGPAVRTRWIGNAAVAAVDLLVLRLLLPVAGVAWAATCASRGWGLFNHVTWPRAAGVVSAVAILDVATYAEHILFHRVPVLWRLHRTHHTDHEVDFTTGFRFHPVEAILSTGSRLAVIAIFGLPALGVLITELLLGAATFWEHANVRMPARLDRVLRLVLVTPEVHQTHHARHGSDNHSNFGNLITGWDRLFGTYRDRPSAPVVPGVQGFDERKHLTMPWMLAQPFLSERSAADAVTHPSAPEGERAAHRIGAR